MDIPKYEKRVVEDELKIGERTFKVKAFDPLLGNYILAQLLTFVLPFGIGKSVNEAVGTEAVKTDETQSVKMMPKKEFLDLQRDILSHCVEVLPAGEAPVVRDNGTYGVEGLTMAITLKLLVACVAFNFSDFFGEGQSMFQCLLD